MARLQPLQPRGRWDQHHVSCSHRAPGQQTYDEQHKAGDRREGRPDHRDESLGRKSSDVEATWGRTPTQCSGERVVRHRRKYRRRDPTQLIANFHPSQFLCRTNNQTDLKTGPPKPTSPAENESPPETPPRVTHVFAYCSPLHHPSAASLRRQPPGTPREPSRRCRLCQTHGPTPGPLPLLVEQLARTRHGPAEASTEGHSQARTLHWKAKRG